MTTRTLIVEDNATFRDALMRLLKSRFPLMLFEEAESAEEAMKMISDPVPDLIFVDLKLPGENGLALTTRIRALDPRVPIVVLTNYDLPEYREAAEKRGAEEIYRKDRGKGRKGRIDGRCHG